MKEGRDCKGACVKICIERKKEYEHGRWSEDNLRPCESLSWHFNEFLMIRFTMALLMQRSSERHAVLIPSSVPLAQAVGVPCRAAFSSAFLASPQGGNLAR